MTATSLDMKQIPRYDMATSNGSVMDGPTHQMAVAQWFCADGWQVYVSAEPHICVPNPPYHHIATQLGSGNENVWRYDTYLQCCNLAKKADKNACDVIVFDATVNERPRYSHCHVMFDAERKPLRGPECTLVPRSTGSTGCTKDPAALHAEMVVHLLNNDYDCYMSTRDDVTTIHRMEELYGPTVQMMIQQGCGSENVWRSEVPKLMQSLWYTKYPAKDWSICFCSCTEAMQHPISRYTIAWVAFVRKAPIK